jgi:hypothetical protein
LRPPRNQLAGVVMGDAPIFVLAHEQVAGD